MMKTEITVGIAYDTVPHGHEPASYVFYANVLVNITRQYGIVSGDIDTCAIVTVDLPDWVVPSDEFYWPMSRPGCSSRRGTGNLCFVECKETAKQECDFFGQVDRKKLIEEALLSGLRFVYPTETGDMASMDVTYSGIRWIK